METTAKKSERDMTIEGGIASEIPQRFHPNASHVNPDYRDGWNDCWRRWELAYLRIVLALGLESMGHSCDPEQIEARNQRELRLAVEAMRILGERAEESARMHDEVLAEACKAIKELKSDHPILSRIGRMIGKQVTA